MWTSFLICSLVYNVSFSFTAECYDFFIFILFIYFVFIFVFGDQFPMAVY